MDCEGYFRFVVALGFGLALIGALALAQRRLGLTPRISKSLGNADRRLHIVDVANVDGKRRLVLVRRDRVEHLILLGPSSETVVETGIPVSAAEPTAARQPDADNGGTDGEG